MSNTQQRIDDLVKNNNILLFMKGNASFLSAASLAVPFRSSRPAVWMSSPSPL